MKSQSRAKTGGEFGANGEWYDGGKFIATTDHAKKAKGAVRTGGGRVQIDSNVHAARRSDAHPLWRLLAGIEEYCATSGKFTFNQKLKEEFSTPEAILKRKETIAQFNSGKRWIVTATNQFE